LTHFCAKTKINSKGHIEEATVVLDKRHDSQRSLVSRVLHGDKGTTESPTSTAEEPCMSCGQETAAGTVFFSDRREINIPDGARVFLCSECQAKAHLARKGEPLSDEDLRTIAKNGGVIGAGFLGGHGGGAGF
jgi:hypothetical protein